MSKEVDERVVSMKFDNKQFEAGVSTSMSTIDKLKKSLNFKDSSKGLENLGDSAKKVNLSGLSGAVETVHAKFSALEVMGVTALSNITNTAVNAGKRIISALTIDPIKTGFQEYELKMGSIQTIMAGTGESLSTVNKYLDELNTYSDKTIYSFKDMTSNIGKFTNAGVKLEDAVLAIKGISNEAAVSGANAEEASRAMYNFSQALSAGYVKLIDWKSIENANMATVEFKNELIKTALALGTVIKSGDKYITTTTDANGSVSDLFDSTRNFNDSLSNQWMTSEVLVKTLRLYTDETTELGKKAYASAQDVKTFTMMCDTLKEAAQSGWAQTWERIAGNFEQAKETFTDLSNEIGNAIADSANSRLEFVDQLTTSKWDQLSLKVKDTGISIDDFKNKLIETAKADGINVDEMIKNHGSFEASLKEGWLSSNIVVKTLKSFTSGVTEVKQVTTDTTKSLQELQNVVNKVIRGDFGNGKERIKKLTAAGYDQVAVQGLVQKVWERNGKTWKDTTITADDLTSAMASMTVEEIKSIGYTEEQASALQELAKQAEETGTPLNDLIQDMSQVSGRDLIINTLKNSLQTLLKVINTVKKSWNNVFPKAKVANDIYKIIAALNAFSVKGLAFVTDHAVEFEKVFTTIFTVLKTVGSFIGGTLTLGFKALKFVITKVSEVAYDLTTRFLNYKDRVKEANKENNNFEKSLSSIKDVLSKTKQIFAKFSDQIRSNTKLVETWNKFADRMKQTGSELKNKFKGTGERILNIIDGLLALDKVTFDNVLEAISKVGDIAKEKIGDIGTSFLSANDSTKDFKDETEKNLSLSGLSFEKVNSKIKDFALKFTDAIKNSFGGITIGNVLTVGIGAGLIYTMKKLSLALGAFSGIGGSITSVLGGIGKVLKSFSLEIKSAALINVAIAIAILAASLIALTLVDSKKLLIAAGALSGLTLAMTGLVAALSALAKVDKVNFESVASLIAVAGAILILALALKVVDSLDPNKMIADISILVGLMAGIVVMSVAMSKFAGSMATSALSILAIGGAILVLAIGLRVLSGIKPEELLAGIFGMNECVIALIVLIGALNAMPKSMVDKAALNILAIGAAMLLLAYAVKVTTTIDPVKAFSAMPILIEMVVLFAALMLASKLAGKYAKEGGLGLLAMATSIVVLAFAIDLISKISPSDITKGMNTLVLIFAMFSFVVYISQYAGENAKKAGAMILMMSISILLLSASIYLLAALDGEPLKRATLAVMGIGVMFAILIGITKYAGESEKTKATLITMTVALGIMAVALGTLSMLDSSRLATASASLSLVMAMFAFMIKATSALGPGSLKAIIILGSVTLVVYLLSLVIKNLAECGDSSSAALKASAAIAVLLGSMAVSLAICSVLGPMAIGGIIALAAMTAVVWAISKIIIALSEQNPEKVLPICIALGFLMMELSKACLILSAVGTVALLAVGGLGTLMLVVAGMFLLVSKIGELMSKTPELEDFINKGLPMLEKLGNGIGSFVGGIVNGVLDAATKKLPEVGQRLNDFITTAKPFFDGMSNLDDSVVNGVKILSSTILELTKSNILDGVSSFMGDPIAKFAEQLPPIAEAVASFSEALPKDFNADVVEKSANAANMLADLQQKLSGGSWQDLSSQIDGLTNFVDQLGPLATGLVTYQKTLSDAKFDAESIQASTNAIQLFVDLANNLPNTGGKLATWIGEKMDFTTFGTQLVELAKGLSAYSQTLAAEGAFNAEVVESSKVAIEMFGNLAEKLPNTGGRLSEWIGQKMDLSTFGGQLEALANGLCAYSRIISAEGAFSPETVATSKSAIDMFCDLATRLPAMGGLSQLFSGEQNLAAFGNQIVGLGDGLSRYSTSISTLNADQMNYSLTKVGEIVNLFVDIASRFTDDKPIENFGKATSKLGDHIGDYYKSTSEIDTVKMAGVISETNNLITMCASMALINTDVISNFGNALKDLGSSGVNGFINSFEGAYSKSSQIGSEFVNQSINGAESKRSDFTKKFESIVSDIINALSRKNNEFNKLGSGLMSEFVNGIGASKGSASQEIVRTVDDAVSEARGFNDDFNSAGVYVVEGFANGMASKEWLATQKGKQIAKAAYEAAKKELDVRSPSHKMYEVGKYTGLGFTNALDAFADRAYKSGANVGSSTMSGVGNAIKKISAVVNDEIDTQPKIRPVLDLTDVASGRKEIQAMAHDLSAVNGSAKLAYNVSSDMNANKIKTETVKSNNDTVSKQLNQDVKIYVTGDNPEEIAEKVSIILQKQVERSSSVWGK